MTVGYCRGFIGQSDNNPRRNGRMITSPRTSISKGAPARIRDHEPNHAQRPTGCRHHMRLRAREASTDQPHQQPHGKALRPQRRLGASVRRVSKVPALRCGLRRLPELKSLQWRSLARPPVRSVRSARPGRRARGRGCAGEAGYASQCRIPRVSMQLRWPPYTGPRAA